MDMDAGPHVPHFFDQVVPEYDALKAENFAKKDNELEDISPLAEFQFSLDPEFSPIFSEVPSFFADILEEFEKNEWDSSLNENTTNLHNDNDIKVEVLSCESNNDSSSSTLSPTWNDELNEVVITLCGHINGCVCSPLNNVDNEVTISSRETQSEFNISLLSQLQNGEMANCSISSVEDTENFSSSSTNVFQSNHPSQLLKENSLFFESCPNSREEKLVETHQRNECNHTITHVKSESLISQKRGDLPCKTKNYIACQICGKTIHNHNLRVHLRTHFDKKPFICETCGYKAQTSSNLKVHLRTHSGEKPFVCHVCNERFRQSTHLKTHSLRHTGEKPFKCDICSSAFTQKSSLKNHTIKIHLDSKRGKTKRAKPGYVVKNFFCKLCDKAFIGECFKREHTKMHKNQMAKSGNSSLVNKAKPKFVCEHCHLGFDKKALFNSHVRECPRETTKSLVKGKESLVRSRKKEFMFEYIEENCRKFVCLICKKSFGSSTGALIHSRIHTGECPYKCNYCNEAFRQLGHLQQHVYKHRGFFPFLCRICDKGFYRKGLCFQHIEKAHKDYGDSVLQIEYRTWKS